MDPLQASPITAVPPVEAKKMQVLSLNRYLILCFATFGLYELWWMYKTWQFFKRHYRMDIMPFARAIFPIFFIYDLFERIKRFSNEETGISPTYSSSGLAWGFFVLNIFTRLPDPLWMVALLSPLMLIPPFKAFHFAMLNSPKYAAEEQPTFSDGQLVVTIVGIVLCLLTAIGLIMDE